MNIIAIIYIITITDVTYCFWDDDSYSVQKTKHLHTIMPPEGSFHRPQDTHPETPCRNWLGQRPEHSDARLILQAGMGCTIFLSTATLLPLSSWHKSNQFSKNPGPVCHPSLQDKSNNSVGNSAILVQQQEQSYRTVTLDERVLENFAISRQHGPSHMPGHGAQRRMFDVSWLEVQLQTHKLYNVNKL
jgi:hypothetical protein